MESTGVYWKPVLNILEDQFQLLLVNARHIKQVPGRKTDVKDSEWIAELLQYGLLRGSFIPPAPQRELRELTRQRTQLMGQKATVSNRIQKVLEEATIKLASVASDVLGVSGRLMLEAIIAGQDNPEGARRVGQTEDAGQDSGLEGRLARACDGPPSLPASIVPRRGHAVGSLDRACQRADCRRPA